MTRRNPPAKWTLPAVINPDGRKLIMLCIPDEPAHIAAFRGALLALASAYKWQDDPEHRAKDVAQVWRQVIEDEGGCLEFRQDDCHLYMVVNGIETLIYNGQECIDANIANGTLAKANSGYLGSPAAQACHTYTARLTPSQWFTIPVAVNTGDTILLSNWQGGATDLGQLNTFWNCPSGTAYALGQCSDTIRVPTSYGTDPLQTAPHLAVIGKIGNTYYDIWNSTSGITPSTFTVPSGIVNQPLQILMNVGAAVAALSAGEMWGNITVCNTSGWCYTWNFATSAYSSQWTLEDNGGYYLSGTGYKGDRDHAPGSNVYVFTNIPAGTNITEIDATYTMNYVGGNYGFGGTAIIRGYSEINVGGSTLFTVTDDRVGTYTSQWVGGRDDIRCVRINRTVQEHSDSFAVISSVTIKGTGTSPFGTSNC